VDELEVLEGEPLSELVDDDDANCVESLELLLLVTLVADDAELRDESESLV